MAVSTGMGAGVQKPLATVIICGEAFSVLHTLFVLPTLYRWFEKKRNIRKAQPPTPTLRKEIKERDLISISRFYLSSPACSRIRISPAVALTG
ncbi:MAG: efflux RND transporter permease subunit [Candidatus Brocadiales bacterium]